MWFWKKDKNNAPIYRRSIGEKITYYQNRLSSSDFKIRENAKRNLYRLNRIASGKESFGKIFIVRDKEFNPRANDTKSRRVVCVGVKNNSMKVIPVRKNKKMVSLSKFDGNRGININHIYDVDLDDIYEKRNFSNVSNDYLTLKEKLELKRKLR